MRIWITATVLLALAVAGLMVVPHAIDWERYRSDIEAAAEEITGHEVTIAGPIDITFLPRPALIVRDVTMISGADSPIGFKATLQQVDVGFRTGPLLVGRPLASELKLTRPLLALDRGASARLRSWPPNLKDWSHAFFLPDLELMTIIDGRLDLVGEETNEAAVISDLSLTLAMTANGPLEAAGLFKTRHHRFTIATNLGAEAGDGSRTVNVELGAQNGVDETTTLSLKGMLHREGPDLGIQARLDLRGPDLRSGLKAISATTGYPSTFLSLAPNQAFRAQGHIQIHANAITTDNVKITLGEKFGSGQIKLSLDPVPTLDVTFDLPTLRLADDTALINFVPLDLLSVFPHMPGKIDVRFREMVYRQEAIKRAAITIVTDKGGVPRIEKANAQLPGLVDVQFKGRLRPSATGRTLHGRLTAVGDDLGDTMGWLGLTLADHGKGWRGFSLESDIKISAVEIALSDLDMRLDTSRLRGDAEIRFSERINVGLDIDIDRLDLDIYATEKNTADIATLLVQQLERLDTSINARFQRLAWKGLRFEEGALSATAEKRHLKLNSLALRTVGNTAMTVEGEVDLEADAVDLTIELTSQFPTRVLRHLDIGLPLTSARLKPLALTGWTTGKLSGFDIGMRANYDGGQGLVEGRAGWIDKQAHYDLSITAEHPDHRALADHFGLAPLLPANDAPGAFQLNGQLRHDPKGHWIAAGNAKFGPSSITGRLAHQDDQWSARLSLGNPRKDSLAPFLTLAGVRSTGSWTPRSILGQLPKTAFRTGWLNDVDGSLSLVAKGGLAGDGLNLSARLDQGFFYVDEFETALWKGDLHAEMSLERRRDQPFVSIAIDLDDIDTQELTEWLGMPKTIDGPLTLEFAATTVGSNVYELVKGLRGSFSLEVERGKLLGTNIPTFRKTLRDRTTLSPNAHAALDDPLTMPLLGLQASGKVHRGIASFDQGRLSFDPEAGAKAEGALEGTLDLLLWIAELTLTVTTDDAPLTTPLALRIVGSPARPQGVIVDQ